MRINTIPILTLLVFLSNCESVVFGTVTIELDFDGPNQSIYYNSLERFPGGYENASVETRAILVRDQFSNFEKSETSKELHIPGSLTFTRDVNGSILIKIDTTNLLGPVFVTIIDDKNGISSKRTFEIRKSNFQPYQILSI